MDKNFIFAILLTTLIVVFFSSPLYQKKFGKEIPVPQQTESVKTSKPEPERQAPYTDNKTKKTSPALTESLTVTSSAVSDSDSATSVAASVNTQVNVPQNVEDIELKNTDLSLTVSTRGGVITEALMTKYKGVDENTKPQLVSEGQNWYVGFVKDENSEIAFKDLIFNVVEKQENSLTLRAELADGRAIIRKYTLQDKGYILDTGDSLTGPWNNPEIRYSFNGPVNQTEESIRMLNIWPFSMFAGNKGGFNKAVFLGQGDRITIESSGKEKAKRVYTNEGSQKIVADSKKSGKELFDGDLSWFAVRNKYFMSAAITKEKKLWRAETDYSFDGEGGWYDYSISKKTSDGDTNIKIYMGPVSFDTLKETGSDLTELMEFSWSFIRPISIAFLWIVTKMHTIISNWGIVLILFSLFIKLALAPLSHKSFVSMQKMSSLQPQINDLREKYKSNPQKLQQATMELYKKEGVNPFGGCLPVLLQMPVFFALYPVIDTSFELRQAMFIPHWIEDLSRPDPFYILPLAMGASMYFQSKPTMGKDPNQKMMLYVMPVMMVILFANFSAGLTLYWFMFNVFSYIQQTYVKPKTS